MGRSKLRVQNETMSHKKRIIETQWAWPVDFGSKRHPVASQGWDCTRSADIRSTYHKERGPPLPLFRVWSRCFCRVSICPVGLKRPRAAKPVQPCCKKKKRICFAKDPNQIYKLASSFREEGVGHRHARWDGMRWTRQRGRQGNASQGGLHAP